MIPGSDEDSDIDTDNPRYQPTGKPRDLFQPQYASKISANPRKKYPSTEKNTVVTDETYLIPYTGKYFKLNVNTPQKTEEFTALQQSSNMELDPSISIIQHKQKTIATIHEILGHPSFSKLKIPTRE